MARTPQVDQHLTTLGLIHVVQLGHMPVDHTLVQGLALFWRPETHTFHFSHVGEMTVSLEDVAFLYGLPVLTGRVVTGRCDFDYLELLATYVLPRDTSQENMIFVLLPLRECTIGVWPHLLLYTEEMDYTSGMDYARDVLMKIRPKHVVWRPYDQIRALMPRYAQVDPSLFVVRIPCIHYWMVMWHYADCVMYQFMLYQTVPPPRPEAWQRMSQLMGYMATTYRARDWCDMFQTEVNMWGDIAQARVMEERPWSGAIEATYLRWLRVHGGAHVVHIPEETETAPVADMSYLRYSPAHVALVKHTLRDVLRACAWAVKKGFRSAGKKLLTSCSTTLDIVGEPHRIPHVLESKGLPTDIASIPDTSDEDELPEPGWEEHRFMQFA
ncbi:hypothetical protein LUZ61_019555 [Rhynchospora tenuis]|uniref:Aminotransferase-like plant mobile domain-containing protein n=1 Tax=Rhynchospora tenuis TaxID=198213 RepID=A0AAD6EN88_9POAL|nr:hypothetical protein LUZ61_019555 [Rhynchospora tenuis]